VGKSSLALESVRRAGDNFEDGVTAVWLASVASEPQVVPELARVLGVELSTREPGVETLVRALRHQRRLLLVDNFEHVLGAAPAVARLAVDCPHLKVLVTSRAPLRVSLEHVYELRGLTAPGSASCAVEQLRRFPSAALFATRARATDPTFELTAANSAPVGELCRYLGGVPLALELAAARAAVLPPEAILDRLRTSSEPLGPARRDAPERHRSLEAAIDWSYRLLSTAERTLFARLAVFVGGFTLEGAEAVCEDLGGGVVDGLAALRDHALIHGVRSRGGSRLAMLEPIRDYARQRLPDDPRAEQAALRYGEHYAAFAETAADGLRGPRQLEWLDRLDDEQANLRAVLQTSLEPHTDSALRVAGTLIDYWYLRELLAEVRTWLSNALGHRGGAPAVRARALLALGVATANLDGDWHESQLALEQCLDTCPEHEPELRLRCEAHLAIREQISGRHTQAANDLHRVRRRAAEVDDPWTRAYVLNLCAMCAESWTDTNDLFQEALALLASFEDKIWSAMIKVSLGYEAILAGDFRQARASLEQSAAEAEAVWSLGFRATITGNLGVLDLLEDRGTEAGRNLAAAVATLRGTGNRVATREFMYALAALAVTRGRREDAIRLAAAAQMLYDAPLSPGEQLLSERYLRRLHADRTAHGPATAPGLADPELDAVLTQASQDHLPPTDE
jgi:predicted ATPase